MTTVWLEAHLFFLSWVLQDTAVLYTKNHLRLWMTCKMVIHGTSWPGAAAEISPIETFEDFFETKKDTAGATAMFVWQRETFDSTMKFFGNDTL